MIGRLTTPRALGLLLVALVSMGVMVALGRWQFGVYDDHQHADALAATHRAPVPLDSALGPDDPFRSASVGIPVSAAGHYDATAQLYVRGYAGAKDAYAVVTPLVTASHSAVLVLRGSSPVLRSPAPAGRVNVTGILEPSQSAGNALDPSRVTDGIRIAALVSDVSPDLYAGYVVLTSSEPADHVTAVGPPLPDPSRWAGVRNLMYALQWWVFAGFVAFMWWRIVSDSGTGDGEAERVQARDHESVG